MHSSWHLGEVQESLCRSSLVITMWNSWLSWLYRYTPREGFYYEYAYKILVDNADSIVDDSLVLLWTQWITITYNRVRTIAALNRLWDYAFLCGTEIPAHDDRGLAMFVWAKERRSPVQLRCFWCMILLKWTTIPILSYCFWNFTISYTLLLAFLLRLISSGRLGPLQFISKLQ